MERIISFIGLIVLMALCYIFSTNRKAINWRTVIMGVLLQFFIALFILKTSLGLHLFSYAKVAAMNLLNYANVGTTFVFGPLSDTTKTGFVFAIMLVGTIVFVSSLMSLLYHIGVMQRVIKAVAYVMVRCMGVSGAESLATAANIFAGQTEAPFVVKPYIEKMTKSELLALMTGGMATIAGGVLAAYVGFGIDAGHLLAASVISAPAALVCAKMLLPESEESLTAGVVKMDISKVHTNAIDAAAQGASDGMSLAINVAAMMLAFVALVALCNGVLSYIGDFFGITGVSFEMITGYLFAPIAFIIGVPWSEAVNVGALLGKKLILNEFVAYLDLKDQLTTLSSRSIIISTYALCGFANIASIAIQIGGIGTLAPSRRKDLAQLGVRALLAGTVACLMTATIAGILI